MIRKVAQPATVHPLRAARKARALSMAALAVAMGLEPSGWRQVLTWEHGANVPRTLYAEKLASVLGFASGDQVRRLCEQWQREHKEIASGE
jgi:ribosome-binding protein aMBF1 (putative translation factor)